MENNETIAEGTAREAREEACAEVETNALIGVYNVARIFSGAIFYRAKLVSDDMPSAPKARKLRCLHGMTFLGTISPFQAFTGLCSIIAKPKTKDSFVPFSEPADWAATPGFEAVAARYKND